MTSSPAPTTLPLSPSPASQPPPVSGREQSAFVQLTPQTSVFVGAVLAGIAKAIIAAIGECVSERTVMRSDLEPVLFGDSSGSDSDSVVSVEENLVSEQAGLIDLGTALSNLASTISPMFTALDRTRKVMGLSPLSLDDHGSVRMSLTSLPLGKGSSLVTSGSSPSIYSGASQAPVQHATRAGSVGSHAPSLTSTLDDRDDPVPVTEFAFEPNLQSPAPPPSSFAFPPDKEVRRRASSGSVDSSGGQRTAGLASKLLGLRPHSRRSSGDSAESVSILHHLGGLRSTSALSTRPEPTPVSATAVRRSRSVRARSASSASLTMRTPSCESTHDWQAPASALDASAFDALLATPTVHVSLTPASIQGGPSAQQLVPGLSRAPSPQPSSGHSTRARHHAPPPSSYSFRSAEEQSSGTTRRHTRASDGSSSRNGLSDVLLGPSGGTRAMSPGTTDERSSQFPEAATLELQKSLPPAITPMQDTSEAGQDSTQVGIALSTPELVSSKADSRSVVDEAEKQLEDDGVPTTSRNSDQDQNGQAQEKSASSFSGRASLLEARQQQLNPADAPSKVIQWGYRGRNRQRRYSLNDVGTMDTPSHRPIGMGGQKHPPVSNLNGLKGRASMESVNATSTPVSSPATASPQAAPSPAKDEAPSERPASSTELRRPPSTTLVGRGLRPSLPSFQQQQRQQLQLQHTLGVLEDLLSQLASPGADTRQLVEDRCASIRSDLRALQASDVPSHGPSTTFQSVPTDRGLGSSGGQFRRLSLIPSATSPVRRAQQGESQHASVGLGDVRPTSPSPGSTASPASGGLHHATSSRAPPTSSLDTSRASTLKSSSSYRRASADRTTPISPIRAVSPARLAGSPDPVKTDLLSSSPEPKRMSLSPLSYAPNSAPHQASPASPPPRQNCRLSYQNRGANRLSVWSGTSASGRTSPSLSSLAEDGDAAPNGTAALPRPQSAASNYNVVRVPQAALKAQIERDRAVQSRVLASLFGPEQSRTQAQTGEPGVSTPTSLPTRVTGTGGNARSRLSTLSAQSVPTTRPGTNINTSSLASSAHSPQSTTRPRSKTGTEATQAHAVGAGFIGGGGKVSFNHGHHSPLHHQSSTTNKVKTSSTVFGRAARVFGGPSKQ